ncbi:MAG TPA: glycosyltransferase family 4 protein [Tepidisphaeraceae bacterium]|jgi:glycosyltransferase involved in cell wall biosynthesis
MADGQTSGSKIQTVSLLGSYVPRQCGIATFTKDLREALAGEIGAGASVIAMDDGVESYNYPSEVRYQIGQHRQADYITAAEALNHEQIDAAIIQHEYGIFGGRDGSHVLSFARQLRMPLIATLHTVLSEPSPTQRSTLRELIRVCDRVVVMSHKAEDILESVWNVPRHKIAYIPHGVPDVHFADPHYYAEDFDTVGRKVLLTFGLLGPGKGIETALKAMPEIVAKHPNVLYIILGATHPHVLRNEGNKYRESLEKMVVDLGLQNHVRFDNRYVTTPDLMNYLAVADVYVIPYPSAAQITSGTLAYAAGAGKAIVSTPFWHAEEMLSDGRGLMFPFHDHKKLSEQVLHVLDNEHERHAIRKRAYEHARPMVWDQVAKSYLRVIEEAVEQRRTGRSTVALLRADAQVSASVKIDMAHVLRMSDDTGIYQHAIGATPDRRHGYCTDDNARSLIAALMHHQQTGETALLPAADRYLSFLHHAFNESSGRFRNFMDFARNWLEDQGSEDSHGRAIWALGAAVRWSVNDSMRALASRLVLWAMPVVESFTSPRAWAFAIIGLHHFLQHYNGDTRVRRMRDLLANRLHQHFAKNTAADWPWLEDVVTYDNAKLPHALMLAGTDMGNQAMVDQALESLAWLVKAQVDENGTVSLIGNNGWLARDGQRARFDQQPIEAMALVEACVDASRVTSESIWLDHARTILGWFTGSNELGICLVDRDTGGCGDGLHPAGVNQNQGAESTLAWIIAALTLAAVTEETDSPEETATMLSRSVIAEGRSAV